VFRHLALRVLVAKRYSEKLVNLILRRFYADTATLRRELVGAGLFQRAQREYLRPADQPEPC